MFFFNNNYEIGVKFVNMLDILLLFLEFFSWILEYVFGRDLLSVCLFCKILRDVVYVDIVW